MGRAGPAPGVPVGLGLMRILTGVVKAGGRKVGSDQTPYFFLPRIQKGRSPGPALARSWVSSALN